MMNLWVIGALLFLGGIVIGALVTDLLHATFTNAAWHTVRCLADQNVELVKELKTANGLDWTEEGEEWKRT